MSSTAPDCDGAYRTFRVTHPFHPLLGREFRLVTFRQNWGEEKVYFYDDSGRLSTVPLQWTTFAAPDPFVNISAGRSAFRVGDLLDLADLLIQLSGESP
jgi:hypothetical protein